MTQTVKVTIEQINSDGLVWRKYDHWVPADGVQPFLRGKTLAYDMTATQFRVDGELVTVAPLPHQHTSKCQHGKYACSFCDV